MAGMTQISATATDRREAARETTGQFGEQTHSAPEATLALSIDDIDAANARRDADRIARAESAKMVADVEFAASFYASRRGQWNDRDDIIGDTIVDVVGQQKRGAGHVTKEAFLQAATRAVSSRYVDKGVHHTTLKARGIFHEETELFLQENGRDMTAVERRELADSIRLSFPAGQRPSPGFETKDVAASLDMEVGEDGSTTLGDLIAAEESGSGYATAMTRAAAANDALEDENSSFKAADARKCIWNLLVAQDGPNVAIKSISDDREHRALVEKFGGPAAVAQAWQQGETAEDDPVNDALFAPFGKASRLTDKDREQITDVLLRNPAYAEKVWDSAMSAALDVQKLRTIKRREARAAVRKAA